MVFHDRSKTKAQSGDVHFQIEVVLGPPETLSSQSPGIAVKAHAEMLLGASPQFVESPWAVAGLSSRDTANGTARGATVDRNAVPCFERYVRTTRCRNAWLERHVRTITDIPCGSNATFEPRVRPLLPVQCFERDVRTRCNGQCSVYHRLSNRLLNTHV